MAHNKYIRNGSVERFAGDRYCGVFLYGEAKYDGAQLIEPNCLPDSAIGRPGEMVLHIAGTMYYPTPKGYEQVERKQRAAA